MAENITREHVALYVVRKSGEKVKTAASGREYRVKYLLCQREDDGKVGINVSIYPDREGNYIDVRTYMKIHVPCRELRASAVNDKYDKNIDGETFKKIFWANGFQQNEVVATQDYYTRRMGVRFDLKNVKFFTSYMETSAGNVRIEAQDLGFPYFPLGLNKVGLEGSIEIFADFQHRLRRFRQGKEDEFKIVYVYKSGTVDISRSDLSKLAALVSSYDEDERMKAFMAEIRERLGRGEFLSEEDVVTLMGRHKITADPGEIIENATLRHDYEPTFFRSLKSVHDKGFPIYYSNTGFVFRINGAWVWEEPKYGSATYLFDAGKITQGELLAVLQNASKSEIYQIEDVREKTGFIRRVIHPKDNDVEEYVQRWFEEVKQLRTRGGE